MGANFNNQTLMNAVISYNQTTTVDSIDYHKDLSSLSLSCLNNYVLSGVSPLICTNGTWYPSLPTCLGMANKFKSDRFLSNGRNLF